MFNFLTSLMKMTKVQSMIVSEARLRANFGFDIIQTPLASEYYFVLFQAELKPTRHFPGKSEKLILENIVLCGFEYIHASEKGKETTRKYFEDRAIKGDEKYQYFFGISLCGHIDDRNGVAWLERAQNQGFIAAKLVLKNLNLLSQRELLLTENFAKRLILHKL